MYSIYQTLQIDKTTYDVFCSHFMHTHTQTHTTYILCVCVQVRVYYI